MQWQVTLYKIKWDDGDGEYDVSELPTNLEVIVEDIEAGTKVEAIERALEIASDMFDTLIASTEQINAKEIARA